MALKGAAKMPFSESTMLRLAISSLDAIKHLHEIGCVHRDIKPANCMMGGVGRRQPREGDQLFRGTPRYCSLNVHYRQEQCRIDDLWSWLYMLIELHKGLPWNRLQEEKEIFDVKGNINVHKLTAGCPAEFVKIHHYLKDREELVEKKEEKKEARPDYEQLYEFCKDRFKRSGATFMDRFEWERERSRI